jgi:hypothetical protein
MRSLEIRASNTDTDIEYRLMLDEYLYAFHQAFSEIVGNYCFEKKYASLKQQGSI